MSRARFRPLVPVLLLGLVGLAGGGDGVDADADDALAVRIAQRVRDWQPTRDERRFDQVGWARNLVEARKLAREHRRPLFLFTYNGSTTRAHAMALQRC